jgi:hypothetical protein
MFSAAILLWSHSALAATTTHFECYFTEPFITMNIDLQKRVVTATSYNYNDPNEQNPTSPATITIAENIKVKGIGSNPRFRKAKILKENGELIAVIKYEGDASDGMSDGVYPYGVMWTQLGQNTGACVSNLLKDSRNP